MGTEYTTLEAADAVGVTRRQWFWLTSKLGIAPVRKLGAGPRALAIWDACAIDTVRAAIADRQAKTEVAS